MGVLGIIYRNRYKDYYGWAGHWQVLSVMGVGFGSVLGIAFGRGKIKR
jgi:hypothetical protein